MMARNITVRGSILLVQYYHDAIPISAITSVPWEMSVAPIGLIAQ